MKDPICENCDFWRDYRDDIRDHPEYDGHCWYKGIMTLNIQACEQFNAKISMGSLTLPNGEKKTELANSDFVTNPWLKWEENHRKGLIHE